MKTAIVVSTYNWPSALSVCLKSIASQSVLPDEVIIADDGSTQETARLIEKFKKDFPIQITHIWQPDEGFQLSKIRNKAIASTDADFIIQIDGDVILHKNYVKDFIHLAKKGVCILGSRVSLSKSLSERIMHSSKLPHINLFTPGIIQKRFRAIYCPIGRYFSHLYKKNTIRGFGCSMAFWREDFIAINGYDERFVGWGCEDRDLLLRLRQNGVSTHKMLFIGIVYHLWHKEADRSFRSSNRKLCYGKDKNEIFCPQGISQYL